MFKKNVFEYFQKVALNTRITVMDNISHQILQKFGNRGTLFKLLSYALCHFVAY
jgi:hypothetical protein